MCCWLKLLVKTKVDLIMHIIKHTEIFDKYKNKLHTKIMSTQKGMAPLIIIIAVAIFGLVGATSAALLGEAPKCPNGSGTARNEKEIGDVLEKGSVTINNGEATTLGQGYVGSAVQNLGICFTQGLGHASGKIKLGSLNPSFYASATVDLSGSSPKAANLNIKVGALPNVPVLSDQVAKAVTNLINQNLSKFEMKKKYSSDFVNGSVTIRKLN